MKTALDKFQGLKLAVILGTAKGVRYLNRNGDIDKIIFTPEDLESYRITEKEIVTHQVPLNKQDGVVTFSRHYVISEKTIEVVYYSVNKGMSRQACIYPRVVW